MSSPEDAAGDAARQAWYQKRKDDVARERFARSRSRSGQTVAIATERYNDDLAQRAVAAKANAVEVPPSPKKRGWSFFSANEDKRLITQGDIVRSSLVGQGAVYVPAAIAAKITGMAGFRRARKSWEADVVHAQGRPTPPGVRGKLARPGRLWRATKAASPWLGASAGITAAGTLAGLSVQRRILDRKARRRVEEMNQQLRAGIQS